MRNNKKYILIPFILIILLLLPTTVMAASNNSYNKLLLGILQANEYILGAEQTISMESSINSSDPLLVNIEAHDTTYNIVLIKWLAGEIATDNYDLFDSEDANEITITSGKDITTSFEVPEYGIYTVCAKNENGDRYGLVISVQDQNVPKVTITKEETNKRNITIVAESTFNTIETIKYAKKANKDETIDFETQGTEITITPAQTVTVTHSFEEDGIYAIYVKDSEGNSMTNTIYAYKDFPIQTNITIEDKTVNLEATGTISNIVEVRVTNNTAQTEEVLTIAPAQTITTSYEAPEYGSYTMYITDEIGFKKQIEFTLIEQVEQLPVATITYSPETATNGAVTATLSFDRDDVTITNNNGDNTYVFTENDNFTFEYMTATGKTGIKTANVTWITPVSIEAAYSSITENNVKYIKDITIGTTSKEFLSNINVIDANYNIYDTSNNEISETNKLATGMRLQAENEDAKLVVTGDINGDGKISVTDISNLKLHLVELSVLTNEKLYAADMNQTNTVTLTDLSQLKTIFVNL